MNNIYVHVVDSMDVIIYDYCDILTSSSSFGFSHQGSPHSYIIMINFIMYF